MNINELKNAIKIAHEAVNEESEPYKLEAFKIILKRLILSLSEEIQTESKRTSPSELATSGMASPRTINLDNLQDRAQELAKNCNISLEELKNFISIEDDKIELLLRDKVFGDTETKQRINASQVVLIAYETIFKIEWVKSSTLAPTLKKVGILDPHSNLSTQLKNQIDIFRKKPSANEYKLTIPKGQNSAYEIIKKLAKGEKLED